MEVINVSNSGLLHVDILLDRKDVNSSRIVSLEVDCSYSSLPKEIDCFDSYHGHYSKITSMHYIEDFTIVGMRLYLDNGSEVCDNIERHLKVNTSDIEDLIKQRLEDYEFSSEKDPW